MKHAKKVALALGVIAAIGLLIRSDNSLKEPAFPLVR